LGVLVGEHPLRERLRAQQMLALYRADRQADALEAYGEARRTLVDDLGIEPSEGLQRLQQAILRHDPSLEVPEGTAAVNGFAPTDAAPPPTPDTDAELGVRPTGTRFRPRRWQLALAGVVILAGSAVAAVVLSSSAGASPHVVPDSLVRIDPRSGEIVSVTRVGAEPQQIAVTPRGIWISHLSENVVSRYDLRTLEVQPLGTPRQPFAVIADARNAWVSSLDSSRVITKFAKFGTGTSTGWGPLDPASTPTIHLPPPGAVSLALGSGYLWAVSGPKTTAGTDDRVWLINPATNRVVRPLQLGRQTTSIAYGGGAAWIGAFGNEQQELAYPRGPWRGSDWLFKVTMGADGPQTHPGGNSMGPAVAVGSGRVWALTSRDELLEFDPARGKVVKRVGVAWQKSNALAVGAGYVWVANQVDASVTQRDARTGRFVRTIRVGNPENAAICAVAAAHHALWVAVGNRNCESSGG
jgi:hypothetical protein